jgi:hypothetical protein
MCEEYTKNYGIKKIQNAFINYKIKYLHCIQRNNKSKSKAIPVTGRGGL